MIRVFVILSIYLISASALACSFPEGGYKYDEKIEIQKIEGEHRYKIRVPKKLDYSGSVKIYLGYQESSDEKYLHLEYGERLRYWFEGAVVEMSFTAKPKAGYKAFVHVIWPGEVCDTVANSKFLQEIE